MYEELKGKVERIGGGGGGRGAGRVYTLTIKMVCPLYTTMFD